MTDEDMVQEAKVRLKDLVENGDPFSGVDWVIVQILRKFLKLMGAEEK